MDKAEYVKTKLQFAFQKFLGRSVITMPRPDWERLIREDGQPTQVKSLGSPFADVMYEARVVAVAASGHQNPDPGIDVVRRDDRDAPYIYNIDHYTVVQTPCLHDAYKTILTKIGITDSPELQKCLNDIVFVVKQHPTETENHWSEDIPARVKNAREKGQLP
jgi:hypothetical protein